MFLVWGPYFEDHWHKRISLSLFQCLRAVVLSLLGVIMAANTRSTGHARIFLDTTRVFFLDMTSFARVCLVMFLFKGNHQMNNHHTLGLPMACHEQGICNGKIDQVRMITEFSAVQIQSTFAATSLRWGSRSLITLLPLSTVEFKQAGWEVSPSISIEKTHYLVPDNFASVQFCISHVQCEVCNHVPCTCIRNRILRKCSKKV